MMSRASEHDEDTSKQPADVLDPATEAGEMLTSMTIDLASRLRFWRGDFLLYSLGAYRPISKAETRANLIRHLNLTYSQVTKRVTGDVLDQLTAQAILPSFVEPQTWIKKSETDWPASEVIAAKNGLVNLKILAQGSDACIRPPTPRFFSTWALEFPADPHAPAPAKWLQFLDELWVDDPQTIDTLQEIFGYLVAGGTWMQKLFFLIGPKRAGKGVVARVLRNLVGPSNCCGPTLSGLGTNFGLWPMLNKSLAVIADARLSGRTDQAVVVERLLSITGEDALTVDRKNMEPLTVTLPTRVVIISNELPRLGDSSGAMASRIVLLRFRQSFYGQENPRLTDELLAELPGILNWAIAGWARLIERGHLVQPESSAEMLEDLEDLGSPVSVFVRERCIIEPGYMTAVSDIFKEWSAWCESKGRRDIGNEQTFGRDLAAAYPDLERTQPRLASGVRYRAYQGIGLRAGQGY
ncbi:MAG TPA: phage/plasmid primase, P4 family [Pirellulales bacterium]|jgi:putative DNA primase/helicase|nr:phage/plasmid primase, P4 family [Pirellulales bacterium]